jgi:hypothetical protein
VPASLLMCLWKFPIEVLIILRLFHNYRFKYSSHPLCGTAGLLEPLAPPSEPQKTIFRRSVAGQEEQPSLRKLHMLVVRSILSNTPQTLALQYFLLKGHSKQSCSQRKDGPPSNGDADFNFTNMQQGRETFKRRPVTPYHLLGSWGYHALL